MVMHVLQANRKCAYISMRKVGELWITVFLNSKQIKKCPKLFYKECTYVQKYIYESDENLYSTQDNQLTVSSSFFHEGPIINVETIE